MSEATTTKLRAAVVLGGPLVLLAALAYHPFIANLTDAEAVAAAMSADTTRWGIAHIAVGIGFGTLLLALLGVRGYLRDTGEERWSAFAVPFLVIGTVLFVFLPAFEVAMIAAFEAGGDPVGLQERLATWFLPLMMSGALLFGAGMVSLAVAMLKSAVLTRQLRWIVAIALVVAAVSRFVPAGAALYAGAVAGVVALLPIAFSMWSSMPESIRGRSALATGRG